MKIAIRPAELADIPTLMAIENESFASPHWQPRDFTKFECYVAEISGEIAGFLVSRFVYAGDNSNPPEREILNVAVAGAFRRRGVATALISREMQRPGECFLEVRESNLAAQRLYRKLGFVEVGRRANYYSSPPETAIVMNMK
ncbi:MAG: ribosomal protein S18-alanine N-acetyltransferase [Acidobacteriaceae bacterium]|nr:ribosomal protein S18-alanine N-acetyltransferase [Acidobacteriaceae bacterium]